MRKLDPGVEPVPEPEAEPASAVASPESAADPGEAVGASSPDERILASVEELMGS